MRFDFKRSLQAGKKIVTKGWACLAAAGRGAMNVIKHRKEYVQSGKVLLNRFRISLKEHLEVGKALLHEAIAFCRSEKFRGWFTKSHLRSLIQKETLQRLRQWIGIQARHLLQAAGRQCHSLLHLHRSGHFRPGNLSQLLIGASRKNRIVSSVAMFFAVCAFGAAAVAPLTPDVSDLPVQTVMQELKLPTLSEQIATMEVEKQYFVREERVRMGDTLGTLLARLGVDDAAATAFIKSDGTARAILQLRAGRLVQARTDESGALYWLSMAANDGKEIVVTRTENGFTTSDVSADLEQRIEMRSGTINSSLFAATDAAQIPDSVTSKMVDMFSTDIDFRSDLRRGDRFNLVYETFWQNGAFVRSGRILAAEFVNAGRVYNAVWFEDASNDQGGSYYTFEGKSLKKAFLKSPLEFTRISSGFGTRVHPISGKIKQHTGIDFAAPSGTPIRAAADGTIEFSGWKGGYGNYVKVKHWNPYSTAYGHMSRIAATARRGAKVRQGDVIGYVGTTGFSTGPHLHYEFQVNNKHQNPRSVIAPEARPLAGAELQRFRQAAADMEHRFALMNPSAQKVALK